MRKELYIFLLLNFPCMHKVRERGEFKMFYLFFSHRSDTDCEHLRMAKDSGMHVGYMLSQFNGQAV